MLDIRSRWTAAIMAALTLVAGGAPALADDLTGSPTPALGPIRYGLTSQDIRAIFPDARWRYVNDYGPETFSLAADDLVTIADQAYAGRIEGGRGWYRVALSANRPATNLAACEAAAVAAVTAVEQTAGPFTELNQLPSEKPWETVLDVGQASKVRVGVLEANKPVTRKSQLNKRPEHGYVRAWKQRPTTDGTPIETSVMADFRSARQGAECQLRISLRRQPQEAKAVRADKSQPVLADKLPLAYPQVAKSNGEQGRVSVRASVLETGAVGQAQVIESSRSDLLDAALLDAVRTARFQTASGPAARALPADTIVSLEFTKDTVTNLRGKTCADLVTDARWFARAWPDRSRQEMNAYTMVTGMLAFLTLSQPGQGVDKLIASMDLYPEAFDQTFAECLRTPEARYMPLMVGKSGIKAAP